MQKLLPSHDPTVAAPRWDGYSLEDIRYRRAVNQVKMEMEKERLASVMSRFSSGRTAAVFNSGLLGRIFSHLSIIDYALIGFQIFQQGRKIFGIFRRK